MELVLHLGSEEEWGSALAAGADALAVALPRRCEEGWWDRAVGLRREAAKQGIRLYLLWDRLISESELPEAGTTLSAVAGLTPDALVLRDLGLFREARRRFPDLQLHAAQGWGCHNSLGLKLAAQLGFSRVTLEGPVGLKDVALMRRQSDLPQAVKLFPSRDFAGPNLMAEYLGAGRDSPGPGSGVEQDPAGELALALETLSGWAALGMEAVEVSGSLVRGAGLAQVVEMVRLIWEASPAARPRVLAAARQVWAAFGEFWMAGAPREEVASLKSGPKTRAPGTRPEVKPVERARLWIEARSLREAAEMARERQEPLLVRLNRENYRAFLAEHRRWRPRRLIWRLPPVMPESALSFYTQAVETLKQGGYTRLVAGDWGGVALARRAGAEVYGDETLGVRNSWAVAISKELGVAKICLPPAPRPEEGRALLEGSPPGSFWGYLYHLPLVAVSREDEIPGPLPWLIRMKEEGLTFVYRQEPAGTGRRGVIPLVVALPPGGPPWNKIPLISQLPARREPFRPRK